MRKIFENNKIKLIGIVFIAISILFVIYYLFNQNNPCNKINKAVQLTNEIVLIDDASYDKFISEIKYIDNLASQLQNEISIDDYNKIQETILAFHQNNSKKIIFFIRNQYDALLNKNLTFNQLDLFYQKLSEYNLYIDKNDLAEFELLKSNINEKWISLKRLEVWHDFIADSNLKNNIKNISIGYLKADYDAKSTFSHIERVADTIFKFSKWNLNVTNSNEIGEFYAEIDFEFSVSANFLIKSGTFQFTERTISQLKNIRGFYSIIFKNNEEQPQLVEIKPLDVY